MVFKYFYCFYVALTILCHFFGFITFHFIFVDWPSDQHFPLHFEFFLVFFFFSYFICIVFLKR